MTLAVVAVAGGAAYSCRGWSPAADELPVEWSIDVALRSIDGTADSPVLATDYGWMVGTDSDEIVSVNPDTGAVQWTRSLGQSRCTQVEAGPEVVCLARVGDSYEIHQIDPETGNSVGTPVPAEVDGDPYLLTPLSDGLLALSDDGVLTFLGVNGTQRWVQPLMGIPSLNLEYSELRVSRPQGGVVLYTGIETAAIGSEGDINTRLCSSIAVGETTWACGNYSAMVAYDIAGEIVWESADLRHVSTYGLPTATLIVQSEDRAGVRSVDLTDGSVGPVTQISDDESTGMTFLGNAEYPILGTRNTVIRLNPELDGVYWQTSVEDDYLDSIAAGLIMKNTLVIDGDLVRGLDLESGELLWSYETAADLVVVDGALVGFDPYTFERYNP